MLNCILFYVVNSSKFNNSHFKTDLSILLSIYYYFIHDQIMKLSVDLMNKSTSEQPEIIRII